LRKSYYFFLTFYRHKFSQHNLLATFYISNNAYYVVKHSMKKEPGRFIYWTPRILAILFILFLAMFSLDIFDGDYGFWGTILGLFMHNIPVIILSITLIILWKRELIAGMIFILAGMLYIAILLISIFKNEPHEWYMLFWALQISGPAFLIGILFLVGWHQKKK
jgi:hypothetical protein